MGFFDKLKEKSQLSDFVTLKIKDKFMGNIRSNRVYDYNECYYIVDEDENIYKYFINRTSDIYKWRCYEVGESYLFKCDTIRKVE
jgi:hypothetical protein